MLTNIEVEQQFYKLHKYLINKTESKVSTSDRTIHALTDSTYPIISD